MADLKSRLERLQKLGLVRAAELASPSVASEAGAGAAASRDAIAGRASSAFRPDAPSSRAGDGKSTLSEGAESGIRSPSGWNPSGDFLFSREIRRTLNFPETLDIAAFEVAQNPSSRRDPGETLTMRCARDRFRFFDFETTGLSGGTGTVAFLAAIAEPDADGCSVRQFFLADYPGERAFLEAVLGEFPPDCILVTYNGRCFDIPLLRTRCIMNGMRMGSFEHIDALYLARRLWRRIHGGASLGLLEREVLGIERGEDVPGALIPRLWLDSLRSGDPCPLSPVFSHNAADVVSLAVLVARISRVFLAPLSPLSCTSGSPDLDRAWLGRSLIELGDAERGESLLDSACADGDEKAGLILLSRYRKSRRTAERSDLLQVLPLSPRSDIERAKFAEHVQKDLKSALMYTERAMASIGGRRFGEAIASRHLRLSERISRCRNT